MKVAIYQGQGRKTRIDENLEIILTANILSKRGGKT
jgi:hypothetical protein